MSNPLVLDLSNANNWLSVYSQTHQAQVVSTQPSYQYLPLSEITLPILFDEHIIAVHTESATAQPNWRFAGFLNQRISLGLVVGGVPDADAVQRRKVWLNKMTLLIFQKLTSTYSLVFTPPHWLDQIKLSVWIYTGPE